MVLAKRRIRPIQEATSTALQGCGKVSRYREGCISRSVQQGKWCQCELRVPNSMIAAAFQRLETACQCGCGGL